MSAAIAIALRRISALPVPESALREMISIVADLVGATEVLPAERAVASAAPAAVDAVSTVATSTQRVRKHRAKKNAVAVQPDLFPVSLAARNDETRHETHETPVSCVSETPQRKVSPEPPSKESLAEADAGARDPPSKSMISEAEFAIADKVRALMRIDPDDTRVVGMAYTVHIWIDKGWKPDLILQAIEVVMARLKGIPPRRLSYFEAPIADAHAEALRPLPQGQPSNNVQVLHGTQHPPAASDWRARRDAGHAALAKLGERIDAARAAPAGGGCGAPHVRPMPNSGGG